MCDESRSRARLVCTRCHSRKVRCDLETRPEGTCGNCLQGGHHCRPHIGFRKRKAGASLDSPLPATGHVQRYCQFPAVDPPSALSPNPSHDSPGTPAVSRKGYMGDQSVMAFTSDIQIPSATDDWQQQSSDGDLILSRAKAATLPPEPLAKALLDFYFHQLFPFVPVVNEADAQGSLLLRQTLYFAGSLMRQPKNVCAEAAPTHLYAKVKSLLFLNHERDPIATLKTLCLLACWSPRSPREVTLESPWQWVATAIRLATQLGFHQESTYDRAPDQGCRRRIWWYLFNNDILQSACYGRPPMLRPSEFDVRLPQVKDFEAPGIRAEVFCHTSSLCLHISTVVGFVTRRQDINFTQLVGTLRSLRTWIQTLPDGLQLYSNGGLQRGYDRLTWELHVTYLVSIILSYLLPGRHRHSPHFFTASVAASSYISHLYRDILYHDDVTHLLPIHGWKILVGAIPQLLCLAKFPTQSQTCVEHLETAQSLLLQLSWKYASARLVWQTIHRLRQDPSILLGLEDHRRAARAPPSTSPEADGEDLSLAFVQELFPFPSGLTPSNLPPTRPLTDVTEESAARTAPSLLNLEDMDWDIEWSDFALDNLECLGGILPPNLSMSI